MELLAPLLIGVLLLLLGVWAIGVFNRLVRERNLVREAWSGIDVQLQRRYDLIPNLVETVQGYAQHERGVFEEVSEKRSRSMGAGTLTQKLDAENQLVAALGRLFAVAEAYPDLKANQNFIDLQDELSGIEEQIQLARRYYNGSAREYNIVAESFPSALVAGLFGFRTNEYFELDPGPGGSAAALRRPPQVDLSS